MPVAAFISSFAPRSFTPLRNVALSPLSQSQTCPSRRLRVYASAETGEQQQTTDTQPPTDTQSASSYKAPSFDTQVFSKFVDQAQGKVNDFQQQIQDVDVDELMVESKSAAAGLVDNVLAGDWLNRGELYGAVQIVFAILLVRGPGALDGLISFISGPIILSLGAAISGKALWDLGRKQLSIWPAPVPSGEFRCDGVYQFVRHPMYAGVILASAGFAVATGSPARMALTFAFAAFMAKKIEVEEVFLKEAYPEYIEYCERVKNKLLPGIF